MDKNSYETYEYLPTAENETNQFFVVQDDGSFVSVNRQIQYVTEVQDVKEVLESVEPCTVYDVSSQQFYIDVDNNAELISVSDEFILPDGENNIFSNNYLLPVTSSTEQQIEQQGEADQHEELETQIETAVDGQSPRQINSCTEITLSNEQYRTLEQKGWILLETNEKVFVLDTLGLHDITSNYKLIQKLKVEDGSINENIQPEYESLSNQEDNIESIIDENGIKLNKEIIQDHELLLNNVEKDEPTVVTNSVAEPQELILLQNEAVSLSSQNSESSKSTTGNTFKLKTDIVFSDVPEKILLGETANGKKLKKIELIEKIKKLNNNNVITATEMPPRSDQKQVHRKQKSASNHENTKHVLLGNTTLNESQFESLIRLAIQNNSEVKCSVDDVASADSVVTQFLKVPSFRPSVLDQNLVITKLKFTKLYNCLKHLKTHFNCVDDSDDNNSLKSESKENQKNGIYKCKMCSSTYLHSSTLSKHIVSKHIKVRSN